MHIPNGPRTVLDSWGDDSQSGPHSPATGPGAHPLYPMWLPYAMPSPTSNGKSPPTPGPASPVYFPGPYYWPTYQPQPFVPWLYSTSPPLSPTGIVAMPTVGPLSPYLSESKLPFQPDLPCSGKHVVHLARDQLGSRQLQDYLDRAPPPDRAQVLNYVLPESLPLMYDVYGNYVVQKLLEHCSDERTSLLRVLGLLDLTSGGAQVALPRAAMDRYACRVLQRAFDLLSPTDVASLTCAILANDHCLYDQNASHVLQKAILVLIPVLESWTSSNGTDHPGVKDALRALVDVLQDVSRVGTHPYAARVLQRMLESKSTDLTKPLVRAVASNALRLSTDAYGNYLVQQLLAPATQTGQTDTSGQVGRDRVVRTLLVPHNDDGYASFACLGTHKYASNVIERLLIFVRTFTPSDPVPRASPGALDAESGAYFRWIVDGLLAPTPILSTSPYPEAAAKDVLGQDGKPQPLALALLAHRYGNYVLQRILDLATPDERARVAPTLLPVIRSLTHSADGAATSVALARRTQPAVPSKQLAIIERLLER